jgi:plastocyanin
MMKIFTLITLLTFGTTTMAKEHIVEMRTKSFVPQEIIIELGDTIKYVNVSKLIHNVVVRKLKIRTKYAKRGQSVTIKPGKTGKYDYYCQPHRAMGMTGTIVIKNKGK